MKLESLLFLALSLGPAAALTGPFDAVPAAPQDLHQKAFDDFVARFKQLLEVNDADGMAELVRRSPEVAVRYADTLCQQVVVAGSAELEKQIAGLRKAWKTAMQTAFVDKIYEYHSLLEPRMRAERLRLTEAYDKALARYSENVAGAKDGRGFEAAAEEFAALAGTFSQVGDTLNVGRCWIVVGACWDEGLRGKEANPWRACTAMGRALEAYDKIGLVGADVAALRTRYDFLKTGGYDQPEPDPNAPKPGQPVAAAGAPPLTVGLAFEPVEDLERFERPSYFADDVYQMWSTLGLAGKGTTAKFPAMQEIGLTIERTGAAQFTVRDASGEPREGITVTGNTTLVRATIKDANGTREWAFLARIGIPDDTYQGRKTHLGPSDQYLPLFYWAGASMVGTIGDVPLRVFDDNLDGVYGSLPLLWQYLGVAPGAAQPDLDSMVVGKSNRALPWSKHVQVGDRWYQLEVVGGGTSLKATPVELETGTLRLDFKGEYPVWLVVRGGGSLAESYFDLLQNGKKPVAVPVGDYELFAGLIRKGKKVQMMKCLILGNESMPKWKVESGKETVVKLGQPLHFEFDVERNGDKGVVKGASVRVVGVAGETYDRFWNCAPEPSVSERKAGTKRGGKPTEMPKVVGDMDELKDDGSRRWSFADVWRPLDLEVELRRGGENLELQMSEKKHKLLGGPIESDWK